MSFDSWKTTDPADQQLGRASGKPEPYACLSCEWTGKGSAARAQHYRETGHFSVTRAAKAVYPDQCDWCERLVEPDKQLHAHFGGRFCSDECATNYGEGLAAGEMPELQRK